MLACVCSLGAGLAGCWLRTPGRLLLTSTCTVEGSTSCPCPLASLPAQPRPHLGPGLASEKENLFFKLGPPETELAVKKTREEAGEDKNLASFSELYLLWWLRRVSSLWVLDLALKSIELSSL